ncbi:MAG: DNA mismatch repair protein [Geoglossum umbratile]|nr:MAG: DNA mismatch repair protein [Geoglossum umbratile]
MADSMEVDSSPRGVKRKAEEAVNQAPRRIKPLDQNVVNKIAAGEIIVAPVHALKELIENAVDAGSTSLEVLVKDGGLKLLQITDNGHGINHDDLPILCERFTTSKLKAFEDLTSIGTYGFRGEALASISHIAHLTVTTRTKDSNCAWRAQYIDGRLMPSKPGLSADPKPTAGRQGTQIKVEDLFYNVPTRLRSFRSSSEEYAKILDIVGRYAVHCSGVAFSCKKHGDTTAGIATPADATTVDRIRLIHGSSVASELVELSFADKAYGFKVQGFTSNANYHVKRTMLLLFINHRAVESSAIKKAMEHTYSNFLPKGGHPFVYLSLDIEPSRVDVNVHPTKREVNFLHEDEIIERICDEIRVKLAGVDTSRTFMTQSLLPGARVPIVVANPEKENGSGTPVSSKEKRGSQKPHENNLVRTDAKLRKITSMLPPPDLELSSRRSSRDPITGDVEYEYSDREHTLCRLTTVKELRTEVRENVHNDLTETFAGHTFVGIVDERKRIAAIQGGVKLFLVDYGMVCNEYFYQVGLTDFANFGAIRFNQPLQLHDLLQIAAKNEKELAAKGCSPDRMIEDTESDFNWDEVVTMVEQKLLSRREMLHEYFSLEISSMGELLSIPLLMKGYMPSLAKLPRFLLRCGPNVNWTSEKECFRTFLTELAAFYVPESLPPPRPPPLTAEVESYNKEEEDPTLQEIAARRAYLNNVVENVMFPAFRARLVATRGLLRGVVEVANLKGLYRVFERC